MHRAIRACACIFMILSNVLGSSPCGPAAIGKHAGPTKYEVIVAHLDNLACGGQGINVTDRGDVVRNGMRNILMNAAALSGAVGSAHSVTAYFAALLPSCEQIAAHQEAFATNGCCGLFNTAKLCLADWEVNAGALLGAVRAEADRDVNLDEVRQSVIDQELSRHLIRKMGQVVAGVTSADLEAHWEALLHTLNTVAARQWQLDTIDEILCQYRRQYQPSHDTANSALRCDPPPTAAPSTVRDEIAGDDEHDLLRTLGITPLVQASQTRLNQAIDSIQLAHSLLLQLLAVHTWGQAAQAVAPIHRSIADGPGRQQLVHLVTAGDASASPAWVNQVAHLTNTSSIHVPSDPYNSLLANTRRALELVYELWPSINRTMGTARHVHQAVTGSGSDWAARRYLRAGLGVEVCGDVAQALDTLTTTATTHASPAWLPPQPSLGTVGPTCDQFMVDLRQLIRRVLGDRLGAAIAKAWKGKRMARAVSYKLTPDSMMASGMAALSITDDVVSSILKHIVGVDGPSSGHGLQEVDVGADGSVGPGFGSSSHLLVPRWQAALLRWTPAGRGMVGVVARSVGMSMEYEFMEPILQLVERDIPQECVWTREGARRPVRESMLDKASPSSHGYEACAAAGNHDVVNALLASTSAFYNLTDISKRCMFGCGTLKDMMQALSTYLTRTVTHIEPTRAANVDEPAAAWLAMETKLLEEEGRLVHAAGLMRWLIGSGAMVVFSVVLLVRLRCCR